MTERCWSCDEALPERARFCPACGQAVTGEEPGHRLSATLFDPLGIGVEPERRHLTVVFCDLVGSTELSTNVDAEEFSELVQAYQHEAVAIARRFAGDVEGYSGDGILFRFGWPEAHDDDAEQAVRAALEIVAAVDALDESRRLQVRVGVHSGLVVVGEMGGAGRRATMALGETMNLAARLQTVAEPGEVVASATTVGLVEGLFVVEPLGPVDLRGIAQVVEAFRVVRPTGVRTRLEASRGRLTPFIGRGREIDVLAEIWNGVVGGRGAAVLVTGEPGVGKSRLAYQVRELASDGPHRWLDATCSPYTQMSVLWPVVELIEQGLGLQADDSSEVRLDRLRTSLTGAGVEPPDAVALMAGLLAVPGVPMPSMSPERRRERTIEVLVAWVRALSRLEPLVAVVEDLHWCDPTTLDVLDGLLEEISASPILLLMTARPEFADTWESATVVTRLGLEPFDDDEIRRLVGTLGGDRTLPEPVVDRIVGSAAGIPLFAEEVGRTVLESGMLVAAGSRWELADTLTDLEIPQTLQGSLLARLDRLGPAKAVAQLAAVIGRDFSFDLLCEVSGIEPGQLTELLGTLVDSALVLEEGTGADASYYFRHILIQETAYESLLRRTRRPVHERIAELLRGRLDAGVNVAPEAIARHYEASGSVEQAAEHYQLAAVQASESSGYREAIAFLRLGISLVESLPETARLDELEVEMQLALGSAIIATKSYADPEIEKAYARARELCERLGNDTRVGLTLAGLSIYYTNRGETTLGAELAERVLEIAAAHDDDTLELLARVQLALPRSYQGLAAESLDHALRAIEIYDPERHHGIAQRFGTDHGVAAYVFAGWGCLIQGYLDRGLTHMDDAVALAEFLGQPFNLVFALAFRGTCHWERGETAETLRESGRARQLAQEQGFEWWAAVSGVWEAAERVMTGGEPSALPELLEIAMVAGASGNRGGSTSVMARVAEAVRSTGDLDTAAAFVDMALATSLETNQPWWDSSLHRMRAELAYEGARRGTDASSAPDEALLARAEEAWLLSLDLAAKHSYPVHGLRAATGYATFLHRLGKTDDAYRLLLDRYERCPEGFTTPVLLAAKAVLDDLAEVLGHLTA